MSKFIDKLKQISQPLPAGMGFRQNNQKVSRPKIQLVALVQRPHENLINKLSAADAVISEVVQKSDEILWGFRSENGSLQEIDKAIEAGADFIVMPIDAEILPPDKKTGKVSQLDTSITDIQIRALNDLPLDAVLIVENITSDSRITWQKLIQLRRFTSILPKPVLVFIQADMTGAELQIIWETGVSGVVLEIKTASDVDTMAKLRELIDGLKPPSPKKRERVTPFIPQGAGAVPQTEEPDEGDDDDDDDD
jgi:hypothetical protein